MDACEDPLNFLPSIRSMKCYSRVCLKKKFPKSQGKNVSIFVQQYGFFLFKTNKCYVLQFSFYLLLHYFENAVSKQSVEKDFAQNFITVYYVHIEWKVYKSSSLFFNVAIRKYSVVLCYKTCIVRIAKFSLFINFDDVIVFSFKSLCKRWRGNLFNRRRVKILSCALFIEIVFD